MAKWIEFVECKPFPFPVGKPKITKIWHVQTKGINPNILGEIKWYSGWRKYCFFPDEGSLYEQECLRDIAEFCEQTTIAHKAHKSE